MSYTDKLSAIERLRLHIDEDFSVPDLSDLLEEIEALEAAHRRASQAATAPSANHEGPDYVWRCADTGSCYTTPEDSDVKYIRADLAAPAPSDALREENERLREALKGMVERHVASEQNWTQAAVDAQRRGDFELRNSIINTALQALDGFPLAQAVAALSTPAPAPSGALREENDRLRGELDWIGNHMVMSMALNESDLIRAMKSRARAALSTPTEERQ